MTANKFIKGDIEKIREMLPQMSTKEAVFSCLTTYVDNDSRCFPSYDTISKDISGPGGVKQSRERGISDAIRSLEAEGRIIVEKRGGRGTGSVNHYIIPGFTFGRDGIKPYSEENNTVKNNTVKNNAYSEKNYSETPQGLEEEPILNKRDNKNNHNSGKTFRDSIEVSDLVL